MTKHTIHRLTAETDGQDLIEYALLCAVLGIACITGILRLTRIREFFTTVGGALDGAR